MAREVIETNLELVRRVYEDWNSGDLTRLDAGITDDSVLDRSRSISPDAARVYRGREEFLEAAKENLKAFDKWQFHVERMVAASDDVLVVLGRVSGRGRGSGVVVDAGMSHVVELRDGLLVRLTIYQSHDEALTAAGLPVP